MKSNLKVAYILDLFPVLSETFIVREILEMQRKHFDVYIIASQNALKYRVYSEVIHEDSKKLIHNVRYFSSLMKNTRLKRWGQLLLSHLELSLRNPIRYIRIFCYSVSKGRKIFDKFIFSVYYAKKIQELDITHLHVHFSLKACTYAMLISKISGIPYSVTVHAHDIFINDLAELLEDKFNNAKFVVCISKFNKQYVLKQFSSLDENKIKIIHCGLDLSAFNPSLKVRNDKFTILSIGRLVEHKGFKYLIEACKKTKEKMNIDFTCNIIGEGKERQNLEELITAYGLTDVVRLSGVMEQVDVRKALESADAFILPCVTEKNGMQDGIPVVLMEAMAMGIPVISTVVSGVPELVQDGAGILVQQKDADGLSKAMMKIMSMKNEDKEILGRRGRAIIEDSFDIEKEAKKLAELITDAA